MRERWQQVIGQFAGERAGCGGHRSDDPGEAVERQRADSGPEPGRRRCRLAVERRVLERDGCEPERDQAGGRSGAGRGSGVQVIGQAATNAQGALALGLTLQTGSVERERARARAEPRKRRLGVAVEHRVLERGGRERELDRTRPPPKPRAAAALLRQQELLQDAGIQVIGQLAQNKQGAVAVAATFQLAAKQPCRCKDDSSVGNSNEPTEGPEPGQRRCRPPVERRDVECGGWELERDEAGRGPESDAQHCGCKSDGHPGRSAS